MGLFTKNVTGEFKIGKRSNFKRIERDYYPTPIKALQPLLPYLKDKTRFVEPCAGDGRLITHLEDEGHICVDAWDIKPQGPGIRTQDATTHRSRHEDYCYITNPPWGRPLLHKMIENLSDQAPTWFLFDADWMHTEQKIVAKKHGVMDATQLMKRCVKIVSVGRVKWIEGSKSVGKDNCAWYLFDVNHTGKTEFIGR